MAFCYFLLLVLWNFSKLFATFNFIASASVSFKLSFDNFLLDSLAIVSAYFSFNISDSASPTNYSNLHSQCISSKFLFLLIQRAALTKWVVITRKKTFCFNYLYVSCILSVYWSEQAELDQFYSADWSAFELGPHWSYPCWTETNWAETRGSRRAREGKRGRQSLMNGDSSARRHQNRGEERNIREEASEIE